MPVLFNGSTGYLEHAGKLCTGYPFTVMCWGTRANSTNSQVWVSQSQLAGDRYACATHAGSTDIKQAQLKEPGSSRGVSKTAAPHTSSTVLQLLVAVFTSTTSRTVYFADNAATTDTASVADGITNHNTCNIGARHYNSLSAELFANGSLAEAHYFNAALTATDVANLIADTVKPEAIAGWVDGWTLKDYEASGNYLSIGGTRTMTAVGGVSASGLTHPIARAGTTTINGAVGSASAAGLTASVTQSGETNIPGAIGSASAAGLSASVATYLVTDPLINNTESLLASQAVVWTWTPAGRIGSMAGLTATDGTGTTNAAGRLVTTIPRVAGRLDVAVRNANATVDDVYYQAYG